MTPAFVSNAPQAANRTADSAHAAVRHTRTDVHPRRSGAPRERVGRRLPPSRIDVRGSELRRPVASQLRLGAHDSDYEREAEQIADRVAGSTGQAVASGSPGAGLRTAPPSVAAALAGAGRPLDRGLRAEMERRFDRDFSDVRIHSGPAAASSARDINARAYTVGSDIVLGANSMSPGGRPAARLIAHELSHVVQQSRTGGPGVLVQRSPATDAVAHAKDPIDEDEHPDHAWHLVATLPSKGPPFVDVIRARVVANGNDVNPDVLDATKIQGYPRNRAVGGRIRPSYFAWVHPTLGAVLRAFAVPSGIHPERMPDPRTLRGENLDYEHYALTPRAGDGRPTYAFPLPLASAPKLSELDKPKSAPARQASPDEGQDVAPHDDPRWSLPYMVARWKAAGLLDGPGIRVRPIPPLPVTKQQAAQLKADLRAHGPGVGFVPVLGFVAAGARSAPGAAAAAKAVADEAVSTAIERSAAGAVADATTTTAASAGAEETGVTIAGGGGAALTGVAIAVAIVFYPSSIAPDPPFSEITGEPTTGLEVQWETQLEPAQRDYLRELWQARLQPTPPPTAAQQTEPEPGTGSQTEPDPRTGTDLRPDDRRRQRQCSPTGLTPTDPIPIVWFKPLNSAMYPEEIPIQGHRYRRDQSARLPHGEPIGVSREYWPRVGKTFRLLPETRGSGADDFRAVLRGYGYDLTALGLQADHVQDIQWEGPDAFENLWPLDMRQNMSAGGRQNNTQVVSLCITPRGPYVTLTIAEVKLMRGGYGRWFRIARVQY